MKKYEKVMTAYERAEVWAKIAMALTRAKEGEYTQNLDEVESQVHQAMAWIKRLRDDDAAITIKRGREVGK